MTTQPSILFALRKEFHFDTLEKVIYLNSLRLLKSNLENKIYQVKEKNKEADVSEQEKMIIVLGEIIKWTEGLYEITGKFITEFKEQEAHIRDLHAINEVLYLKLQDSEKEFNCLHHQQTF